MISSLRGKINKIWGNSMEIEVNGVGYLVKVGLKLAQNLHEGDERIIQTYMAVSENDISLYGFENQEDVELFKMLITVSGIGPKTAAQIVGQTESVNIIKAIGDADVNFFQKIKGIGKKTAQRIIVDLKSKIGGLGELQLDSDSPLSEDELVMSLKQLGFDRREIEKVTKKMPEELQNLEDKLSWCLRNLG